MTLLTAIRIYGPIDPDVAFSKCTGSLRQLCARSIILERIGHIKTLRDGKLDVTEKGRKWWAETYARRRAETECCGV